jgi:putative ABC transport system permease protein
LQENISATTLEKKFPSVFRTILGEEEFSKSKYTAGLQPLKSIHLDTYYPVGIAPVSNPMYAYILAGMAALLLFVACINFVTLSIGRSVKRAKEVGIRKVVGAARAQLITQFIGEALLVTMIALGAGIVLAGVGLPLFNDLSGKHLIFQVDGFLLLVALVLMVVIGLIAGSYPAFVLSNFKPIAILKGKMVTGRQGVRKVLVGIQIVLSIFLVSSTLIMRQQLSYLQNKDLGFHREQLAVIPLQVPRVGRMADRVKAGFEKVEQFKAELVKIPEVLSVGGSSHDFANGGWTNLGYTDDQGTYRNFTMNIVDDDYIPTLKIEMKTGRNFSEANTSDQRRAIIVNEAFVREYGWKEPLGKRIPGKGFIDHEIIGVVKDFNYASLYTKVTPLVMAMDATIPLSGSENINIDNSPVPKLMIRFRSANLAVAMEKVKEVWDRLTNGQEFEFAFVDQALAAQYRNDQNLSKIVSMATLLAMVIGSLGLYALAALAMQNRTKEIGIRKVMGATESSLLMLLSKDYVYLIGISLLFSIPITWYLMRQWLQAFEYKINVGWGVFAMAGTLSLLVALLTISYQVVKSAWAMPAETLKYE